MKGNVDYNRIKSSANALNASTKETANNARTAIDTYIDGLLTAKSGHHDNYLKGLITGDLQDLIDQCVKVDNEYEQLRQGLLSISSIWESVDYDNKDSLLEAFKSSDFILESIAINYNYDYMNMADTYTNEGYPAIGNNSLYVSGFVSSSVGLIEMTDWFPLSTNGLWSNKKEWKEYLIFKYESQGYSKEEATSMALFDMVKSYINETNATNASVAISDIEKLQASYLNNQEVSADNSVVNLDTTNDNINDNNNNTSTTPSISYRVATPTATTTTTASVAAGVTQAVENAVSDTNAKVEEITNPDNSNTTDTTTPSTGEETGSTSDTNTDTSTDNNTNNNTNNNTGNNTNNNTQTTPPASNNNTNNTPSTPQQPQDTTSSNTNRPATGTNNGASYNNSSTFNSTSPQAGPSNTLTPDSSATEVIDQETTVSGDTTTDLPTGNTGPGNELDVISIDKTPSTSSTGSSNDGGSVIPAVIGVGAAAAAGVAGVKYIKDKKQKDNLYDDEDENSFSYLGDYSDGSENTDATYDTKYKAGNVNNLVLDEAPSDLHIEEGMPEMSNEELE